MAIVLSRSDRPSACRAPAIRAVALHETLGVANTDILDATVAVMYQPAAVDGTAIGQGLFQGIQHEDGVSRARTP